MTDMSDILKLVQEGRLSEATASIQRNLGTGPAPSPARPQMKDITPRTLALPDAKSKPKPRKRGKTVRPRQTAWVGPQARGRTVATPPLPEGGTWLSKHGALPYRLFVPATSMPDAPLLVMLHGCTQTPEDFAAGTAMCRAADAVGAHVVFPEQVRMSNANGCWNWFEPAHQGRSGEAAALVSVVRDVLHEIGEERPVHSAGLSAGGAMAAILGAHYPDVFASVGVHSGLPVGSANDVSSAFAAMGSGGRAAVALKVPAIVFHGTADRTVAQANGAAFLPGGAVAAESRAVSEGGRHATVFTVETPGHAAATELWEVEGLGHAWSGGDNRGSYADPAGPNATAEMMRFFASTR